MTAARPRTPRKTAAMRPKRASTRASQPALRASYAAATSACSRKPTRHTAAPAATAAPSPTPQQPAQTERAVCWPAPRVLPTVTAPQPTGASAHALRQRPLRRLPKRLHTRAPLRRWGLHLPLGTDLLHRGDGLPQLATRQQSLWRLWKRLHRRTELPERRLHMPDRADALRRRLRQHQQRRRSLRCVWPRVWRAHRGKCDMRSGHLRNCLQRWMARVRADVCRQHCSGDVRDALRTLSSTYQRDGDVHDGGMWIRMQRGVSIVRRIMRSSSSTLASCPYAYTARNRDKASVRHLCLITQSELS